MAGVNYTRQYETPIRPENWTGDAGRFYRMLIDVLDDIYLKYGRIDEKMLGSALAKKINSKADNGDVAEIKLEQGKLTASFTSLSGAVTQLTLDVDGLGLAISDSEQRLQTQIDAVPGQIKAAVEDVEDGLQSQIDLVPGQITAAVEDAEKGLQAQIDLIPDQITLKVQETVPGEVESALDGYTPTGIVDGSQLIITKEQTHIDTPQFSVNVNGTNGDMTLDENGLAADVITSPSVRPMYTGPDTMIVSTGVLIDSNAVLGVDGFVTLSDAFAKLSGKYLPYEVTINVGTVAVDGTDELWYTDGAPINILGLNKTINGRLAFSHTRNQINISGLNLSYAGGDNPVTLQDCYSVVFSNCIFTVSRALNSWSNAFYANQSHVEFYSCGFFGGYAGLFVEKNAHAVVDSCYGSGNDYGIFARNNAQIGVVSSWPYGAAGTYATADSVVRGATATSTGTAPSTPTQTTTVELDCTDSRTYAGGWYNSATPMVAQGVVNGTTFRGYMWFDFSSVRGKTIQRAAIRLYRKSGIGKNRAVDVYIGAMNCAGPGNPISSRMNYGKITVAGPKEQIKVTIPTEMLQAIANGSYNGLFVYSSSADDYAAFDGFGEAHPPALLVTY